MSSSSSSASAEAGGSSWWVLEAQDLWLAGSLDKCVALLDQNYRRKSTSNGQSGGSGKKSSTANKVATPTEEAALLHNVLLANYLYNGTVIKLELPPKQENPENNTKGGQKRSPTVSSENNSLLDPAKYRPQSIKWALSTLGAYTPVAWYNLALLFFVKNRFRQAARVAEESLDREASSSSLDNNVTIQLHFILVFSHIKLFNYSHPRVSSSLAWLEKTILATLDALKKKTQSSDRITALHERLAWIHILRTQLSLVGGKVKATKRELSLMNSALHQLSQSRGSTNNTQGSTSTQSTVDDEEDRQSFDNAGALGASTRAVAQILRARLHDVRHNPSKGSDELDFSPVVSSAAAIGGADTLQTLPQLFPDAYWNNLAILSLHKGKPARAVLPQFIQAAASTVTLPQNARKHSVLSTNSQANNNNAEILYNSGLVLMQLDRFADALACFQLAAKNSPSSLVSALPMLGLRMAECHVQVYLAKREQRRSLAAPKDGAVSAPAATIRVVVPPKEDASEELTAHICTARNELYSFSLSTQQSNAGTYKDYVLKLYSSTLIAFLDLELKDYVQAREWASRALALARPAPPSASAPGSESGAATISYESQISNYILLANMYALQMWYFSEASIRLGDIEEAEKCVQQAVAAATLPTAPVSADLRIAAKCGLAAVFLVKGSLDQASKILDSIDADLSGATPPNAAILKVWLHIKRGDTEAAISVLKRYRLPTGFIVKSFAPNNAAK